MATMIVAVMVMTRAVTVCLFDGHVVPRVRLKMAKLERCFRAMVRRPPRQFLWARRTQFACRTTTAQPTSHAGAQPHTLRGNLTFMETYSGVTQAT